MKPFATISESYAETYAAAITGPRRGSETNWNIVVKGFVRNAKT